MTNREHAPMTSADLTRIRKEAETKETLADMRRIAARSQQCDPSVFVELVLRDPDKQQQIVSEIESAADLVARLRTDLANARRFRRRRGNG